MYLSIMLMSNFRSTRQSKLARARVRHDVLMFKLPALYITLLRALSSSSLVQFVPSRAVRNADIERNE